MLRKLEFKSMPKTLVLSVVICVFLLFFSFGLGSTQSIQQSDGPNFEGFPGGMLHRDSLDATSMCEICDPGCIQAQSYKYRVDQVSSAGVSVSSGGDPDSTVTVNICSTDPDIMGLSLTPDGTFSESIIVDIPIRSDGTGYVTYYLKGLDVGLSTMVTDWPAGYLCGTSPEQVSCCCISVEIISNEFSVSIREKDSTIYYNPDWAGPGYRIYPGKINVYDTVNRRSVRIEAINVPESCKTVYLAALDIDDPSDSTVIDPDGPSGGDNSDYDLFDIIDYASVTPDSNRTANWFFDVGMQPGDNYRFVATCNENDLFGIKISGPKVTDSEDNELPTESIKITPSLTVWRQLHIELDSMGPVKNNLITGSIVKIRNTNKGTSIITFEPSLGKEYSNSFENGAIWIQNTQDPNNAFIFNVIKNDSKTVTVKGTVSSDLIKRGFFLFDDDDFNKNNDPKLGDDGEDIPEPDITYIQNSDNYLFQNILAGAYIMPVYDLGTDTNVPFWLQAPTDHFFEIYRFDYREYHNDPNYWIMYLLGAYQPGWNADCDPDKEKHCLLGTTDAGDEGAMIYFESLKEKGRDSKATTAHEVGHLLGANDGDGGIMNYPSDAEPYFSDISIKKMRSKKYP